MRTVIYLLHVHVCDNKETMLNALAKCSKSKVKLHVVKVSSNDNVHWNSDYNNVYSTTDGLNMFVSMAFPHTYCFSEISSKMALVCNANISPNIIRFQAYSQESL